MKNTSLIKKLLFLFLVSALVSECGLYRKTDSRKIPVNVNDRVQKNLEEGKRIRFGKGGRGSGNFEFATSNEMWRVTLEILDFVPLANADYGGGIINTDWYSENENTGESIKLVIRFLTNEIRSDAIDLKIFYRKCSSGTNCKINERTSNLGVELKKEILKLATIYKKEANNKKSKRSKIGKNQFKEN